MSADLSITVSAPGSVSTGATITYTISLTNSGADNALAVSLTDTLPAGLTLLSASQISGPDTFTAVVSGNAAAFTSASMPAGSSDAFAVVATVTASVGNTLSNTPQCSWSYLAPIGSATIANAANTLVIGYIPAVMGDPAMLARWKRMVADGNPFMAYALRAGLQNFPQSYHFSAIASYATNDPKYATFGIPLYLAYAQAMPLNANNCRDAFEWPIVHALFLPFMTPAQAAASAAAITRVADWWVGAWQGLKSDRNYLNGSWMLFMLTDLVLGTTYAQGPNVGGFGPATAIDQTTARNSVAYWSGCDAGGAGCEGTEYSYNTLAEVLTGVYAALSNPAVGSGAFSDVLRRVPDYALQYGSFEWTQDLRQRFQWGDNQYPRQVVGIPQTADHILTWLGVLQGLTAGTSNGHLVNDTFNAFVSQTGPMGNSGPAGTHWGSAAWRLLYFYDPYTPQSPAPMVPTYNYCIGTGNLTTREANGDGCLISFPQATNQPHGAPVGIAAYGDVQVYEQGEWALTHPLGYGIPASCSEAQNTFLCGGISSMRQRQVLSWGGGTDWWYVSGHTWGVNISQNPSIKTYCTDWLRFIIRYAPGYVFFLDIPQATPPLDEAIWTAALKAEYARNMAIMGDLNQFVLHMPTQPTAGAGTWSWTTAKLGRPVTLHTLAPTPYDTVAADETTFAGPWSASAGSIQQSEKHWQVRVGSNLGNQRLLHAVRIAQPAIPTAILDATGQPCGVAVGSRSWTCDPSTGSVVAA